MSEPKTRPTEESVAAFIETVEPETKRQDCRALIAMMERITGARAVMWGSSIAVLEELIGASVRYMRENYPAK